MSGKSKTDVKDKLKELHSDLEAGVRTSASYTVEQAVADWTKEGRDGRSASTLRRDTRLLRALLASIGGIPLHALRTHDIRRALSQLAASRSSATVALTHNLLVRAIRHAEAGDHVRRDVAALVKPPLGKHCADNRCCPSAETHLMRDGSASVDTSHALGEFAVGYVGRRISMLHTDGDHCGPPRMAVLPPHGDHASGVAGPGATTSSVATSKGICGVPAAMRSARSHGR